jgi:NADH-quinone oxidoreductase subunit N
VVPALPMAGNITLVILTILLIGLGVYPTAMMTLIPQMMRILI